MLPSAHQLYLEDKKRLKQATLFALAIEVIFFLALGIQNIPFLRDRFNSTDYIDAQIMQMPANAHLSGEEATKDDDEVVFNQKHHKRTHKEPPKKAEEHNQVDQGPPLGPTHGPVAIFAPPPVIPAYLRNQNLKTGVVIEFLITAQGQVTPRLLQSSGSDELDQIAIRTVQKWQFKPAAKDNVPMDSKTRLRILFEVS